MSWNRHEQLDHRPESPNTYEGAFVRTVLHLLGVEGTPTSQQWNIARKTLDLFVLKSAVERLREHRKDIDAPIGGLSPMVGVERAFMLVRFESVLPPDAEQKKELDDWLDSGFLLRSQLLGPSHS